MSVARFDCFALSERGEDHEANEDHVALDPEAGLFAIADGMGGRPEGAVASRTAVDAAMKHLRGAVASPGNQRSAMKDAFRLANAGVWDAGHLSTETVGMGTTMSILQACDGTGCLGHVGDSRIYRFREGRTQQLTTDHSLVAELVKRGHIPPEAAAKHPLRGRLTKALGPQKSVTPEVLAIDIAPGDIFILATDGLARAIETEWLFDEVRDHCAETSEALCRKLIAAATAHPLRDDVTVAVVKVGGVA